MPAKPPDAPNFLEDVVRALLKARRLLATSYGIGYLIPDTRRETREAHETLQVSNVALLRSVECEPSSLLPLFRASWKRSWKCWHKW